jgi:signal transduction histidine kinase
MIFLKLKQLFFLAIGVVLLCAAMVQGASAAGEEHQTRQFSYSIYQDETREMGIDSVQNASFKPINYINRQSFSSHAVWLKIEAMGAEKTPKDWSVKFLPALLLQATVYKPNEFNSSIWESHDYGANALASPLLLGTMPPNTPIYLRLHSDLDFRLNLIVGESEKIDLIQRRIDMFVIMISTISMLTAIFAFIRIFYRFNWVSVGLLLISVAIATSWINNMGLLHFMTGIDQSQANQIFPVSLIGGMFSFLLIWMCLATQLFKGGRLIKYVWILVVLLAVVFLIAFVKPVLTLELVEVIYRYGQWICFGTLIAQAFVAKDQLRLRSEKVMFAALLLFVLMPFPRATNLFKPFVDTLGMEDIPLFVGIIFIRTSLPLAALFLMAWSYDFLGSQRVKSIQTKLESTKDALEKESGRLKQQKQFIAMLTHELKNPLMASAMALSSIRHRLLGDGPSLQRVDAISYSLDEIDGIIERCSEIDKYEQGYIPINMEKIPLGVILSLIKSSHTSERIYSIVRGCDENQLINTDVYYVKSILNNLLTNAIKYAVPESLIEFKVEALRQGDQSDIVFAVSNEVVPESAPNPDLVFQRYYRAEMAKQQSGAGLGLWLAQSMAHALGTEIHYVNQANTVTFHFAIRV